LCHSLVRSIILFGFTEAKIEANDAVQQPILFG